MSFLAYLYQEIWKTVQALLLMGHYLQSTMELNQCWSVVGLAARIALGVGLHLDPTDWDMDPIEKELRSRTWYGCLSIDRVLALKYGRPPAIRDDETITIPLPEPFLDDESSQNYDTAVGLRATIALARILEEMRSSHYTPSSPKRSKRTTCDHRQYSMQSFAIGRIT